MNSDNLQSTLSKLIQSGSRSNPAMNTLINDYTKYHVVLIFILLSLFFWTQFKRVPEAVKHNQLWVQIFEDNSFNPPAPIANFYLPLALLFCLLGLPLLFSLLIFYEKVVPHKN